MSQMDCRVNLVSQRHLCCTVFRQSDSCEHILRTYFCMSNETKNSVSVSPLRTNTVPFRASQFVCERDGNLPVWVRAPKHGHEFYSGCSRPKLYEWVAKGFIRSVSIREPGRIKGVRLFHLASILAFIERCEAGAFTAGTNRRTR